PLRAPPCGPASSSGGGADWRGAPARGAVAGAAPAPGCDSVVTMYVFVLSFSVITLPVSHWWMVIIRIGPKFISSRERSPLMYEVESNELPLTDMRFFTVWSANNALSGTKMTSRTPAVERRFTGPPR